MEIAIATPPPPPPVSQLQIALCEYSIYIYKKKTNKIPIQQSPMTSKVWV